MTTSRSCQNQSTSIWKLFSKPSVSPSFWLFLHSEISSRSIHCIHFWNSIVKGGTKILCRAQLFSSIYVNDLQLIPLSAQQVFTECVHQVSAKCPLSARQVSKHLAMHLSGTQQTLGRHSADNGLTHSVDTRWALDRIGVVMKKDENVGKIL